MFSLPYILMTLLLAGAAYAYGQATDSRFKSQLLVATWVVFFLFLGCRGFVQTDWTTYYPWFQKLSFAELELWEPIKSIYEPGFIALGLICKSIWDDYNCLVLVVSIINSLLLYNFLRTRIDNIPLGLLIFFVFEGMIIYFNLLRNSISILIFINSLTFIERRRPVEYFACCILALSFHMSSIAFFPLYFFFHLRPNRWVYLGVFIACNVIFLSRISIVLMLARVMGLGELFETKLESYTELYDQARGISIGYLERFATGVLIFLMYDKLHEIREKNAVVLNAMLCYFVATLAFSEFAVFSKRISTLFVFGYWIMWVDLMKCFTIQNNVRLYKGAVVLYCMLKIAIGCNAPEFSYENILFGAKSYNERLYEFNRTYEEKN